MKVAIVKLSSLGDVVHALPVAAALRARFPEARITWIVERREAAVLRDNPALDEVFDVDTRRWRRARTPGEIGDAGRGLGRVLRRLREARFDIALDLQGLIKSGLLTAVTRAPLRIGFAMARCREPLSALFTNRRVVPPPQARHAVEEQLALLAPLGIHDVRAEFALPCEASAEDEIEDFFSGAGVKPRDRVVVLNAGAGRADKRWPVASFHALARRLVHEARAHVLVVWGPSERESAEAIADGAGVILVPPTNVHGLLAVLRRASILVAGDTGPLHLAAALGTTCVGLYGPTPAVRNGPYGAGHTVVTSPDGTMAAITVDAVFRAAAAALE